MENAVLLKNVRWWLDFAFYADRNACKPRQMLEISDNWGLGWLAGKAQNITNNA